MPPATSLEWVNGADTGLPQIHPRFASIEVYLSTDESLVTSYDLGARMVATHDLLVDTFDPGGLDENTTYYWMVSNTNVYGITDGPVWSFTTGVTPPPPDPPGGPIPGDGDVDVDPDGVTLSWTNGAGTSDGHPTESAVAVYLSRDETEVTNLDPAARVLAVDTLDTTFAAGILDGEATYWWRVQNANGGGVTAGPVWSFDTALGQGCADECQLGETGCLDPPAFWTCADDDGDGCLEQVVETCDDANLCTEDTCDTAGGCEHVNLDLGETDCGLGECRHTMLVCVDGVEQVCDPFEGATAEWCNGLDDDCNGLVDDAPCHIPIATPDGPDCMPQPAAPVEKTPAALLLAPILLCGLLRRRRRSLAHTDEG